MKPTCHARVLALPQRQQWHLWVGPITLTVLLTLWLLVAPFVYAQQPVNIRVDRLDNSRFPEVHLLASVTDAQGRPIRDLSPASFVLRENGQAVPLTAMNSVQPQDIDLRVVVAIDISGSIAASLEQVKQAAVQFVDSLQPNDKVALVLFGNTARIVNEFTSDHGLIINSINAIGPNQLEEFTALNNAAILGVRHAATQNDGRRAMVIVSDGKDTVPAGEASFAIDAIQREASENNVPIYVLGVGPEASDQELSLLATSGRYQRVEPIEGLAAAYTTLGEELRQQYALNYISSLPADSATHTLDLSVNVPNVGTADAALPLVAEPPVQPYVRLTLPPTTTLSAAIPISAEILARNQPITAELLLDGQVVLSDTLTERHWNTNWSPPADLSLGEHQLAVRVTDDQGAQSQATPQIITLETGTGGGVPWWVWVIVGVLALLIIGFIIAIALRRPQATTNEPSLDPIDDYISYTPIPPTVRPPTNTVGREQPAVTTAGVGGTKMPPNQPQHGRGRRIEPTELANPPQPVMAMLVVERGSATREELQLFKEREALIGRQPDADLVLNDGKVSAQHARVRFMENGFTIVDLGSTNGMRVNGRRINRIRLQDNDRVEIGDAVLVFKQVGQARS